MASQGPETGLDQHFRLVVRLETAAAEISELETALEDARRLRDAIVVEAIDDGLSIYGVAKAAQVSPTRVTQILARTAAEG